MYFPGVRSRTQNLTPRLSVVDRRTKPSTSTGLRIDFGSRDESSTRRMRHSGSRADGLMLVAVHCRHRSVIVNPCAFELEETYIKYRSATAHPVKDRHRESGNAQAMGLLNDLLDYRTLQFWGVLLQQRSQALVLLNPTVNVGFKILTYSKNRKMLVLRCISRFPHCDQELGVFREFLQAIEDALLLRLHVDSINNKEYSGEPVDLGTDGILECLRRCSTLRK